MPAIERSPLLRNTNTCLVSDSAPFEQQSCEDYTPDCLKYPFKQSYASELNTPESPVTSYGFAEGADGIDTNLFEALVELIIEKI